MIDCFLPGLWPFVSFSHFINRNSCLRNYISQGILMKLSSYCFHVLKMIIFTEVMLDWFYQSYGPLAFFNSKSCLCNSSCSFQWILITCIPSTYCSHDLKRIILYRGCVWLLCTRVMALCHYNNSKTLPTLYLENAWARILIVGIWLRING